MTRPAAQTTPVAGSAAFSQQIAMFVLICVIWGLTWIPIKVGVAVIPPTLFAAVRGLTAGPLLLTLHCLRGGSLVIGREHKRRLLLVGLLSYAATYGLLFWGVGRVDSGLAAVVHFSLTPTCLLLLSVALGEERFGAHKLISTAIGVAGIVVLNAAEISSPSNSGAFFGLIAIIGATFVYCLGIVMSRRLLRVYSPMVVAGWVQFGGGLMLLAFSTTTSATDLGSLRSLAEPTVLASLGFLVIFSSIIAFSCYLRLTHEWSPHKAGFYAFVSPAIAVIAGGVILGERLTPLQAVGIALLVAATFAAVRNPSETHEQKRLAPPQSPTER